MEQTFNLVDEISTTEYDMMERYRDDYGCNGDYISTTRIPVKSILSEWEAKNQDLYQVLGKKLILSKTVQYNKDIDEIVDEMNVVLSSGCVIGRVNRRGYVFRDAFQNWVRQSFKTPFKDYILEKGMWDWSSEISEEEAKEYDKRIVAREGLYDLINVFTLAENEYKGNSFSITLANGKEYKVNRGVKPLRVLGKIAESFNLPEFEDFRICHSYALNQKSVGGEISLSIHPLDYWTMSDNACGWESCMSWEEFGGYRRGTVEMMNSPYVVVAYLNSTTNDFKIKNEVWSNKKWRQLFIVSKDFIVGVKEYPYHNEELSTYVLNWLKELAEKNMGWKYLDNSMEYKTNTALTNPNFEGDEFKICFETRTMYNDFGSCHHRIYLGEHLNSKYLEDWGVNASYNRGYRFNFSGNSQCMCCGKIEYAYFDYEGSLYCQSCERVSRCEECGEHTDRLYELDGDMLCECCYDSMSTSCISCDTDHYHDNTTQIIITPRLNEELMKAYCHDTWLHKKENEIILAEHYECDAVHVCQCSPECIKRFEEDYLKEGAKVKTCTHYCYGYPVHYVYYDELNDQCGDIVRWNRWNSLCEDVSMEAFVQRHFNRADFTRFIPSSTND